MTPAWGADWAWSVPLTVITLAIHVVSVTGIAILLTRAGTLIERWKPGPIPASLLVAATVGGVGGSPMALPALEAAVWPAAYLLLGAVGTVTDAMPYWIDSIATQGASGLKPQPHWKMMGALEAVNGVLL